MMGSARAGERLPQRYRLILIALMLGSFALRMWRLDAKSIWWDESLSLHRAQGTLGYILSNRISLAGAESVDQHPPLYFAILSLFLRCCGQGDLTLRFPSVAFATLTVPLLYVMGLRLGGPRAGLLAALLGALSPFYLWYAQEARMYTLATALGLASLYCLCRAIRGQQLSWAIGWALLTVAGIGTHYLYLLLLAFQAPLALALWPRDRSWRKPASAWGAPVALALIGLVVLTLFLAGREAIQHLSAAADGRRYIPLDLMVRDAANSFAVGLSASLRQAWPLDLAFGALYCLGVVSVGLSPSPDIRSRWAALLALVGYLFLPILGMWIYSLFRSMYMGSRYVIMASPAFYLGVGIGLDRVCYRKRAVGGLLVALLALGMGVSTYRFFTHERYRTKEDHRSSAEYVRERERQGDLIILTAPENLAAFEHYYTGQAPVVTMPRTALDPNFDREQMARDMAAAIESHSRVWFAHCRTQHSDPTDQVLGWLEHNAALISHKRFPSWGSSPVVNLYYPGSPVRAGVMLEREPIDIFDERLALVDYALHYRDAQDSLRTDTASSIRASAQPDSEIPSGGQLTVAFEWHTLRDAPNVKLSLRLVDERGVVWEQVDRPLYQYTPTELFAAGSALTQEALIQIPPGTPPGPYGLELNVYDAQRGAAHPYLLGSAGATTGPATLRLASIDVVSTGLGGDPPLEGLETIKPRAVFGRRVELLAYSLGPKERRPGEDLEARLFWQALKRVGDDLRLVLNWRDAYGEVWHSETHTLTGLPDRAGPYARHELIRGIVRLQVPEGAPAGRHTLHLLMHDAAGDRYLWLSQGWLPWSGRDLLLGEVIVQ